MTNGKKETHDLNGEADQTQEVVQSRSAQGPGECQGQRTDRNRPEAQARPAAPDEARFNYFIDVAAKWHGSAFYFGSTYACPGPTAISPTFEAKFARMEFVGNCKFGLSFMPDTGKWVVLYERLSLDECLDAIRDEPWFQP